MLSCSHFFPPAPPLLCFVWGVPVRLFRTVAGLRSYLEYYWQSKSPTVDYGSKLGFVPTMGAFHAGHLRLISRAASENEGVVVSIFLNPLQFEPGSDLEQYPRSLDEDCKWCEQLGVDVVFAPTVEQLYGQQPSPDETTQVVPPAEMMSVLCAPFRPGHFQGVATVVTKLLNIVQPTRAYFGEKDAQQLAIIRRLVKDLNLPTEIQACPIVREASGLACSSRNQYLMPEQKEQALVLYRSLQKAEKAFGAGDRDRATLVEVVRGELALAPEVKVEYVELVHPKTLEPLLKVDEAGLLAIACWVGSVRLIDNVMLGQRQPIVAIDGPAGAGKSTVTRRVAETLGLLYLDTGAMYRALTWLVLQSGTAVDDEPAITELASQAQIQLLAANSSQAPICVLVNGEDVTQVVRTPQVTAHVSAVAAQPAVRRELVKQQQSWGQKGGFVAEGRDIGTHVFPDANLKVFLTASVPERANRRWQELQEQGSANLSLEELEREIEQRDAYDRNRQVAPLRQAADAIEIQTDQLSVEEVIAKITRLYQQLEV